LGILGEWKKSGLFDEFFAREHEAGGMKDEKTVSTFTFSIVFWY
jgi:hypothetical protein